VCGESRTHGFGWEGECGNTFSRPYQKVVSFFTFPKKINNKESMAAEIQTYLIEGELPEKEPLEEILDRVRSLPSEALAQVAAVAVQTLAARTGSTV
jgi:hypothetical protein